MQFMKLVIKPQSLILKIKLYLQLRKVTMIIGSLLYALLIPKAMCVDVPALPAEASPFGVEAGLVGKTLSNTKLPLTPKQRLPFTLEAPKTTTTLSKEMAKITFVLNRVDIEGNSVFTTAELQSFFTPYLHHKISLAKLQQQVDAVTEKYQNAGYFLSKALLPPQDIKNGRVQVKVVEGFISHVDIQGIKQGRLARFLKRYEHTILASKPIKLADLERVLLILNDIPGIQIKSVLSPDPNVPLASTLTFVTTYKPAQALLSYDNYQTLYLGPYETTFNAALNSLLLPGGTTSIRFLSANNYRQLNYYELRHTQTLGTKGLVLSLDGYETHTNPQFILAPLNILGFSSDVNVGLSYPIVRSKVRSLSLLAQAEYMSNSSDALGFLLYNDQIRDLIVTTQYNDIFLKGEDYISFVYDEGFNILGANNAQTIASRAGATPNFLKLVLTASRTQYLNDRFSLYALVTSQYANRPLFAAETMIFGGPYIGRGYDWAQYIGDQGVAGKAELRINIAPDYPFLKQVQYYAFYDVGKLWSLIPEVEPVSGASAGFGLRAALMRHINVEVYAGKPLTSPNATQLVEGKSGHQWMGYFQITAYI